MQTPQATELEQSMKFLSAAILTGILCASAAHAQNAIAPGDAKPTSITANFQLRIPLDASAPTADVTKALAQANQSLGDLANRQCDVLAAAFKGDCRVVQLNMGANVNDRRFAQQFNNDFAGAQRFVNANLNVTFELTSPTQAPNNAPVAK
jgi:hypothetical protein